MKRLLFSIFILAVATGCSKEVTTDCKGPAKDQFCTTDIDPVCGCDKKTYNNGCEADRAGVKQYTKGSCP